jgi:hypothetical protein
VFKRKGILIYAPPPNSPNRVGIRNTSDYSPFGVELDGRTVSLEGYRFGFQNQEKDDEIKGEGNSINYTFRMHDPRLARFFAVDPLIIKFPHYSSYSFSGNKLIHCIELEGAEDFYYTLTIKDGKPVISNWRKEDNWLLMDIFGNYVAYESHITYNGYTYTFRGRWDDKTKLVDEFKADPDNDKWNNFIYRDDLNKEFRDEVTTIASDIASGGLGLVKLGVRMATSTSSPNTNLVLGKYKKGYIDESENIRNDLGIPKNWKMTPSKKNGGIKFTDPNNSNNHIRVMPGQKNSKFENTRDPYVIRYINGSPVNEYGKKIPIPSGSQQNKSDQLHVPMSKFKFNK